MGNAADNDTLKSTINDIDGLSQEGCSGIVAGATMALAYLKTKEAYIDMETIARALTLIRTMAQHTEDCINAEAESAGCNMKDSDAVERAAAHREALAVHKERLLREASRAVEVAS
jgi:hypothetical protein